MANEIPIDRKLSEIFTDGYEIYESLPNRSDATNSFEFQLAIKKSICHFEDSTRLVSLIGMFSKNEGIEEIPTEHIKYLLLPFFLGELTMKLTAGDRGEIVEAADVYIKDFLKRCDEYGFPDAKSIQALTKFENKPENADQIALLLEMAEDRNTKLRKYREKKELDDDISKLKLVMEREQDDDATKREFFLKLIKSSILESFDEIKCLSQERQMQQHMKQMRLDNPNLDNERPKRPTQRPLKPIIITRDAAQKAVYGLGYPSFPTMTVAEFYEQRVAEGIFPDPDKPDTSMQSRANKMTEEEEADKEKEEMEKMEEVDDERLMERNRAKDDWKDDHRRGEGNRHNRS